MSLCVKLDSTASNEKKSTRKSTSTAIVSLNINMSTTAAGLLTSAPTTSDSKYNMKQFINAARSYLQTRAEDTGNLINRHLQIISVTIDLSIFDPHTNTVSEFFVSLYELLANVQQWSVLAWCCVNVLSVACRNSAARHALIHTYQFLPSLSRLLGDQLTTEKKIRLLSLMQELTCGINISWQIPHLPHLMSTLIRWVKSEEEEVVTLSLGVLVNLCYKNLPAVYVLSRCVDIKQFLRTCMPLKGLKIEVHVCKLLIILDYMNGTPPEGAFLKLIEVTFKSILESFKAKDSVLLRHMVEFFLDMWKQNNHSDALLKFNDYNSEVEKLIQVVEDVVQGGNGDNTTDHDSECMALLFEFFHFLLQLKLAKVKPLHPRMVNVALKWIQRDQVCSEGLTVLRTIAVNTTEDECTILEPFLTCLPIFMLKIKNGNEEILTSIENNKRLSSFMELLRVLVKNDSTRSRVLEVLNEELLSKIFRPLLGDNLPTSRASNADTSSVEALLLYINALALIHELGKYDTQWIQLYKHLMEHKQVHMLLAQGIYRGPKDTKALIMLMSSTCFFPTDHVTAAMCEFQPSIQMDAHVNSCNQQLTDNLCFPVMSVTQLERLDEVMAKLREACEQNNIGNVSTSDVMELYEYKLATMSHAERAAISSAEAASQHCTHLQHRTAQLSAELSRLHQLLLHTQQCQENEIKTKDTVLEKNKQLQACLDTEKIRCSSQKKILTEKIQLLEETQKRLKEADSANAILEEKHNDLKQVISKLEDNIGKKEKLVERKDEQITRLNASTVHLKAQLSELEQQAKRTAAELSVKTHELSETTKELRSCRQILGTITQLTTSQYVNK